MGITLALAGDTMLGRGVADRLVADPGAPLLSEELCELARSADHFIVNLECCISDRGERIREPGKPFFFRAPPLAAQRLADLGVGCVTLANNHALDYGSEALQDTLAHLGAAGIACVGAGGNLAAARRPVVLDGGGLCLRVVAVSDHPASSAAQPGRPGIAYADLRQDPAPDWLRALCAPDDDADAVLVAPHWGPNMRTTPLAHVRRAADALVDAGATLIAGHSAHVPQGVAGRVLFDLGDFVDDYRVDPVLRNDLGLLWIVTLDRDGPTRVEGVPVCLEYAFTRRAGDVEAMVLLALLEERCEAVGAAVHREGDRFVFTGP